MIPTLLGITIVSFCVMQLSPGDPILQQFDAQGGQSGQNRDAYLIQMRDLKTDRPLLVNFRNYYDYHQDLEMGAYLFGVDEPALVAYFTTLAEGEPVPEDAPTHAEFLRFEKLLAVKDFEESLGDKERHEKLAKQVLAHAESYFQRQGNFAVADAMDMLQSDSLSANQTVGLVRVINLLVVEAAKPTYSTPPKESETEKVQAVWDLWWEREAEEFEPLTATRTSELEQKWQDILNRTEPDPFERFSGIEPTDIPFFHDLLFADDLPLEERALATGVLNLLAPRPLKLSLGSQSDETKTFTQKWRTWWTREQNLGRIDGWWPRRVKYYDSLSDERKTELKALWAKALKSDAEPPVRFEQFKPSDIPFLAGIVTSNESTNEEQSLAAVALNLLAPIPSTIDRSDSEERQKETILGWQNWWKRQQGTFSESVSAERTAKLETEWKAVLETSSDADRKFIEFKKADAPFVGSKLVSESSSLEEKITAIELLKKVHAPLPQPTLSPESDENERDEVVRNWLTVYELDKKTFEPSVGGKLYSILGDTQYAHMLWRLVTFQFGKSALKTKEPVSGKIWNAFVVSAPLMLMAQMVIYFIAVPLGITCAVNRNNLIDRSISLSVFALYSMPGFIAGLFFLLFFCYGDYVRWFPMERLHSPGAEELGFVTYAIDYLWHCVGPVICLSIFSLAAIVMYARTSMLDVIGQDFIRTARAKGVPNWLVIYKHAFRNSLIPILTLFSNILPAMLGGSVLIEYIFSIPGMGRLGWESIYNKDYPTLMALLFIQAILVLVSILITDLLYVLVDPRISYGDQSKSS